MLNLLDEYYGTGFETPYVVEFSTAFLFLIAVIILLRGYFNSVKGKSTLKQNENLNLDIQQLDVLGLPISLINNDEFPKEGVLFNTNTKTKLISTFFSTLMSFVIFGIIVALLS